MPSNKWSPLALFGQLLPFSLIWTIQTCRMGGFGAHPPPSLSGAETIPGQLTAHGKFGPVTVLAVADKAGCYRPQKEP